MDSFNTFNPNVQSQPFLDGPILWRYCNPNLVRQFQGTVIQDPYVNPNLPGCIYETSPPSTLWMTPEEELQQMSVFITNIRTPGVDNNMWRPPAPVPAKAQALWKSIYNLP